MVYWEKICLKLSNIRPHMQVHKYGLLFYIPIILVINYGVYRFYIDYKFKRGILVSDKSVYKFKHSVTQHTIPTVKLAEEGYKGFNIIQYHNNFYGLAQGEGAFDIKKVEKKEYKRCFVAGKMDEVKKLIDQSLPVHTVKLIEKGYKGFNIIQYHDKLYGIAQNEGVFDIEKIKKKEYIMCLIGKSVDEVKQLIEIQNNHTKNLDKRIFHPSRMLTPIDFYTNGVYPDPRMNYSAKKAFDKNKNTLWHSPKPSGTLGWLAIKFAHPAKLKGLTITTNSPYVQQSPIMIDIEGSSDNINWKHVTRVSGLEWKLGETKQISLGENNMSCQYYKFDFSRNRAFTPWIVIADIDLFGDNMESRLN